jgi:hypothetical protein
LADSLPKQQKGIDPMTQVRPASPHPADSTLKMSVANMTFMIDRLGDDCAPLQYIRELTQNSLAAIQMLGTTTPGEIVWDVDWKRFVLVPGVYKLSVIDTGVGMTGEEMVHYINKLSSSAHEQSATGNFGVGAKIAAAPKNHRGVIYLSWKAGIGYMIHLWRDPDTNVYGLKQLDRPDGTFGHWAYVDDVLKPPQIDQHGTMVVLLGNDDEQDTMRPLEGTAAPLSWIVRYLNTRYFCFPSNVTVKAREGWELPEGDKHNFLRTVTGQQPWLADNSSAAGCVMLSSARAYWWILKEEAAPHGRFAGGGHVAALYQSELYEHISGRGGVSRLQSFGVIFGHNRVVIYVEPDIKKNTVTSNTARTNLLLNGEPLPWGDWAAEFRDRLPEEISRLMEQVTAGASTLNDHKQAIKDRLKQIRDLFKISRYRAAKDGKVSMDDQATTPGGLPRTSGEEHANTGRGGGGRGGRGGDIYALFLTARGTPGEEFVIDQDPEVFWVRASDGTRTSPYLEDRAARFLPQQNMIHINADFRVFTDMVDRWSDRYSHVPGCRPIVENVVREWFEQELIEAVLGAQALKDKARQWSIEEVEQLWSEESLTAVVLPRYHIEQNVKRTLGAKLGTLKDRVA